MTNESSIAAWVEDFVVDLGLCPFAAEPARNGRVRYVARSVTGFDAAIAFVLDEVERLFEDADTSTTLCIFEGALDSFDEFLDVCAAIEALLEQSGADDFLQIAHFHPDYVFEGADEDDAANYTNRAPAPVVQLLRVSEVEHAIAMHPDPEGIPDRNIEKLRALGVAAVRRRLGV